jgi:TetR/AcrR family transcriptional regulator, repressor for neighboring sulfatase
MPEDDVATGQVNPRRGRPTKDVAAPHGPDDVREALVRTAVTLFAEQGIAAVAVRQVATAAGVNPGLVHRYVGTKDDLIRAAVQWAAKQVGAELGARAEPPTRSGTTIAGSAVVGDYERIMAHLSLEGYDIAGLGLDYPLMRNLVDELTEAGFTPRQARLRAVCSLALASWGTLGPLVSTATGLDPEDEVEVRRNIDRTRRWLTATP